MNHIPRKPKAATLPRDALSVVLEPTTAAETQRRVADSLELIALIRWTDYTLESVPAETENRIDELRRRLTDPTTPAEPSKPDGFVTTLTSGEALHLDTAHGYVTFKARFPLRVRIEWHTVIETDGPTQQVRIAQEPVAETARSLGITDGATGRSSTEAPAVPECREEIKVRFFESNGGNPNEIRIGSSLRLRASYPISSGDLKLLKEYLDGVRLRCHRDPHSACDCYQAGVKASDETNERLRTELSQERDALQGRVEAVLSLVEKKIADTQKTPFFSVAIRHHRLALLRVIRAALSTLPAAPSGEATDLKETCACFCAEHNASCELRSGHNNRHKHGDCLFDCLGHREKR